MNNIFGNNCQRINDQFIRTLKYKSRILTEMYEFLVNLPITLRGNEHSKYSFQSHTPSCGLKFVPSGHVSNENDCFPTPQFTIWLHVSGY